MDPRTQRPAFLSGELPEGVTRHPAAHAEIYQWDRFFLPSQCRKLIGEIGGNVAPSVTAIKELQSLRTSKTGLLYPHPGSLAAELEAKVLGSMGFDVLCSDLLQGQVYDKGGEYKEHFDFFADGMPGYREMMADGGQRTWTFMLYLNTVKEGGGTHFPELGVTFKAKAGRALIWNNLMADGMINPMTLHAGLPVKKGQKVIITKWFREAPTWAQTQIRQPRATG